MRVAALISGGKDSCFNMMQCVAEGHDLVALVNLYPHHVDELDSYMFQTVGHHAIDLYSQAMGLPLYRAPIKGGSVEQGRDYHPTAGDEVEDLYQILKKVKEDLQIEAVSVGAILSNYQRVRVENVCSRLGLTSLAYLWRRDQTELLGEMIDADIHAIIIKVAALGLTAKHLGKSIKEIQPHMEAMKTKYQLNVCGEGGEYETFTLDCPLFSKRIVIDDFKVVQHDEDDISPVFYIHFNKMHLAAKDKIVEEKSFAERIRDIKMKWGKSLRSDLDIPDLTPSKNSPLENPEININCSFTEESETCQPPLCNHGNQGFAWVSGVRASSKANGGSDSSVLQSTEVAMETLKEQLQSQGYGLQDAVLVHLYVRDMADFAHINSIYGKYFSLNPPARVCVQASLPQGTVLQLDCLAHHTPPPQGQGRGEEDRDPAHYRTTMHVQGLSHWAPANIGPYSQAVQIGNLVFCAGIIALCPSSMRMIEGGINAESRLSLRSVARVLAAMQQGLGLRDVVAATCYLTQLELEGTARNHWLRSLEEETAADEHQELCSERPSIPCLVNYVVVPSLPRGALVEWHVVAATDKHTWQYYEAISSGEGVTVELKVAWCSQSGAAFISARVDPRPNTTEINLHSAVKALVSAVSMEMNGRGWDTHDILSFKVFHDQSQIPQSRINAALHTELTQSRDRPVHFASLPVKSLPPPCILDACTWIQTQPSPTDDDADL